MSRSASHTAAHKLGQILGLLVIPIIVLWSFYFLNAKSDIDRLSREITGVVMAKDILQERAAATPDIQSPSSTLPTPADSQVFQLHNVLEQSGLGLDSERESHAMAEISLVLLPQLQQQVGRLHSSMGSYKPVAEALDFDNSMYLLAAGGARSTLQRIEVSFASVGKAAEKRVGDGVAQLKSMVGLLEKKVSAITNPALLVSIQHDALLKASHGIQNQLVDVLKQRLEGRRANAWRSLILLTMAGAASALAGIGLAVLMMRSTLLQLDEVVESRQEAVEARREAEQMALRFSTINTDISRLNEDLANKMRELQNVQDELIKRGRLEQLGQVTATIAHEIRNPLGAIRTSAFLLERKVSKMGADVGGHLERINNSVNRCDTIISQLLDFSRTKEVNSSLSLLDEWVAKVVREEAQRLPENIFIECSLGLDGVKVAFDPARLQRAIINLLSNSCEALQSLTESAARPEAQSSRISITTLRMGDFAAIRIADNGPGIAAEYLQKIREPLFTTKSFGTGLGIPAVEQIAAQHNGRLDIASEIGNGATFTIHLPLPHSLHRAA